MIEKRTCRECGREFNISRKPENRLAMIRYCQDCKKRFSYVEQSESCKSRAVTERRGRRGRTGYLSKN